MKMYILWLHSYVSWYTKPIVIINVCIFFQKNAMQFIKKLNSSPRLTYPGCTSTALGCVQLIGGLLSVVFAGLLVWLDAVGGTLASGLWCGFFVSFVVVNCFCRLMSSIFRLTMQYNRTFVYWEVIIIMTQTTDISIF